MPQNDAGHSGAGQLRLVLQIGQHIRYRTVAVGYLLLRNVYGRGGDPAFGHADLAGTHADCCRFDLFHLSHNCHSPRYQPVSFKLHAIGGLRLDALLQGLKLKAQLHVLTQAIGAFVSILAAMPFDLVGRQQVDDRRRHVAVCCWRVKRKVLAFRVKGWPDAAVADVVDVEFELLFQRGDIAGGNIGISGFEVGLRELEHLEAEVGLLAAIHLTPQVRRRNDQQSLLALSPFLRERQPSLNGLPKSHFVRQDRAARERIAKGKERRLDLVEIEVNLLAKMH
jgi:hypothetical protein